MKIRLGFVSNSSSTSFCIVGLDGDYNKKIFCNIMKGFGWTDGKDEKGHDDPYYLTPPDNGYLAYGMWEQSPPGPLQVYGSDGPLYIGISANSLWVKDNLTFEQAQQKVADEIKKATNIEINPKLLTLITEECGNG